MENTYIKSSKLARYWPYLLLGVILLIGAFFRLYRIREYLTFLGDEGRDVLVVKRMLVDGKFTLLGPITSVGSIYMGPVYYYMMAPFLLLSGFDPVGPAIMVAMLGIATIALIYFFTREFFSQYAAIAASLLYAISPLPVLYGRASWNPNVVPFFAILLMYGLLQSCIKRKTKWLIVVGLCLGILIQLHYVTFLFFPIIIFVLLLYRKSINMLDLLLGFGAFLLGYAPFLIFELRHDFVNTMGAWRFLWQQKNEAVGGITSIWSTITDVSVRLFWRLLIVENAEITKALIFFGAILIFIRLRKNTLAKESVHALVILFIWLGIGIMSFGIYRGVIYDYYFGSMFALPFIFAGIVLWILTKYGVWGKALSAGLLIALLIFNLKHSPLKTPPSNLLQNTQDAARFVYDQVGDRPYNFALIAGKNSDHAYRYFLELWGKKPVVIENPAVDPNRDTVTRQLFVVCEEKVCQPLGHPLWEIAGFGRSEIATKWEVSTVKVFKLVPYRGSE